MKTSETYKNEILDKYKLEKGGKVSIYLVKPTSANIRAACILLLNKRNSIKDNHILNHFFQFKNESNKLKEIQDFDVDKFKPIVNFLKGRAKNTSTQNIELISWLIDFQPRPLQEYLKKDKPLYKLEIETIKGVNNVGDIDLDLTSESSDLINARDDKKGKWSTIQLVLTASLLFGVIVLLFIIIKPVDDNETWCMTWSKNHFERISCDTKPYSKYGTEVVPYEEVKMNNFKKIEVDMATDFFAPVTNKPLIWYAKNKDGGIEYFTNPGLHPITGKTLDEITPYIIKKYVPLHSNKIESFVQ
jgi:hypothetical protein